MWEKGKIDVPSTVAKDRRRRFVPIHDALAAWLAPWRGSSGPCCPVRWSRAERKEWLARSGVQWKQDALRHSYASYRLALTENLHALALEMGNSLAMLHKHYLDLKHAPEAAEWFAIRPEK